MTILTETGRVSFRSAFTKLICQTSVKHRWTKRKHIHILLRCTGKKEGRRRIPMIYLHRETNAKLGAGNMETSGCCRCDVSCAEVLKEWP